MHMVEINRDSFSDDDDDEDEAEECEISSSNFFATAIFLNLTQFDREKIILTAYSRTSCTCIATEEDEIWDLRKNHQRSKETRGKRKEKKRKAYLLGL